MSRLFAWSTLVSLGVCALGAVGCGDLDYQESEPRLRAPEGPGNSDEDATADDEEATEDEDIGTAQDALCSTTGLSVPNDRWRLKIWDNKTLSGDPVEIRYDAPGSAGFSFQWGAGSVSPCAAPETFSVAFQRSAYFPCSGDYLFKTFTDDGVKLLVDGVLIVNAWYDQVATHEVSHYVTAGWHTVRMNYYENQGGAGASLQWGTLTCYELTSNNTLLKRPCEEGETLGCTGGGSNCCNPIGFNFCNGTCPNFDGTCSDPGGTCP
jgi:hypothetical protein